MGFMIEKMRSHMRDIRQIADEACDSAQAAGVTGAINWGDLGVVEVRFCINEDSRAAYEVLIEEASPGSMSLIEHVQAKLAGLHLDWPVEIRTEW
jgi:hypothetical protein